jgi:hypothetical protein
MMAQKEKRTPATVFCEMSLMIPKEFRVIEMPNHSLIPLTENNTSKSFIISCSMSVLHCLMLHEKSTKSIQGDILPPMHTYKPLKSIHAFPIKKKRLICDEFLFVCDKPTESGYPLDHEYNKGEYIIASLPNGLY